MLYDDMHSRMMRGGGYWFLVEVDPGTVDGAVAEAASVLDCPALEIYIQRLCIVKLAK
jgi:hypothetical protein